MSTGMDGTNVKWRESVASLVLCGLGIAITIQALRLRFGSWEEPGPGFFPFWSGAILASLSFLVFVKAFLGPPSEGELWRLRERWGQLALVVGVLLGYALVLEALGFLLSTFVLLVVLFRLMRAGRLLTAIGSSGAISALVYVVFKFWLGVQLPSGLLRF